MDDRQRPHKHVEKVVLRQDIHRGGLAQILLDEQIPIDDVFSRGLVDGVVGVLVWCLSDLKNGGKKEKIRPIKASILKILKNTKNTPRNPRKNGPEAPVLFM